MKIELTNQKDGVKANLNGFSAQELGAKIEACQKGICECSCNPAIMQKIDQIELSATENGATITITGDVNAQTIEPMMKECLMGDKE